MERVMIRLNPSLSQPPNTREGNTTYTKRVLNDKETSAYIGMSASWLRHGRIEGSRFNRIPLPPFIKIGRSVRYLIDDLDAWLAQFEKFNHLAQFTHEKLIPKHNQEKDEC